MDGKRLEEAEASFRQAISIDPNCLEVHFNLGILFHLLGRLDKSVACINRAVEIAPDSATTYNMLGIALRDAGRLDEAVTSYRKALELNPGYAEAHSNLIFTLDLAANTNMSAMQAERRKWHDAHAAHLLRSTPHSNIPDPQRKLRIGYVSADLSIGSSPRIFGAMLFEFDASSFEVFVYSNDRNYTKLKNQIAQSVSCWREIAGLSDEAVVSLIEADGIDILVDLSGHSRDNRLPVFARKPAPLQITAWGYSTGTGMKAMDVLFSDRILIPEDEEHLYAEQVRYLPIFFSYYLCDAPPAVNELPALANNCITFGTFTRMEKVLDETYLAWAKVLLAVPGSRLLFKNREMDHEAGRRRVAEQFFRAGVSPDRLVFMGKTPWKEHMAAFNRVDIALDTFPQCGGVTTLEGLLMGVPVITLNWPTFAGRTGTTILTTLGLSDWIAESSEQYVELAVQKAGNLQSLADLRRQLRDRMKESILCDAKAYTRLVEKEYRVLWREWCEKQAVALEKEAQV
jgi:predicted O-linked N-acetylglucosamine transferase (SPINDLY family)